MKMRLSTPLHRTTRHRTLYLSAFLAPVMMLLCFTPTHSALAQPEVETVCLVEGPVHVNTGDTLSLAATSFCTFSVRVTLGLFIGDDSLIPHFDPPLVLRRGRDIRDFRHEPGRLGRAPGG